MPEGNIAAAHEADQHSTHRMAALAAAKAKRLWPNIIGEVLADEIMALLDLPSWLRLQTRTQRLIDAILSIPEDTAASCAADTPKADTPKAGATRAA
jgi:hypothetical protein